MVSSSRCGAQKAEALLIPGLNFTFYLNFDSTGNGFAFCCVSVTGKWGGFQAGVEAAREMICPPTLNPLKLVYVSWKQKDSPTPGTRDTCTDTQRNVVWPDRSALDRHQTLLSVSPQS